ncbi:ankyrin repeat-containing domain protein, partial [Blyttiomyces helicus]
MGRIAMMLIRRGARVNAQDARGRTALHWAVARGDARMARMLLREGAEPRVRDANGRTPVHMAMGADDGRACLREMVETLSAGEDCDNERLTPLHWAVLHHRVDMVQAVLASGGNPRTADVEGKLPL